MKDAERPHKSDRRAILSWCLYDWANSAFPTVITTFVFATYYVEVLATDTASGTADWGNALSISGLLIAHNIVELRETFEKALEIGHSLVAVDPGRGRQHGLRDGAGVL